jgi:GR25 family glycosyltransferase involved in LPS biosynthesis
MKFCHKVFHIDGDTENEKHRKVLTDRMNSYLEGFSEELNTPTIKISNDDEYKLFYTINDGIRIDPQGYNLHDAQGWRWGELGIWASNYAAWKNFAEGDYDYLMLMEDDIVYHDDFKDVLVEYMKELPDNFDMFAYCVPERDLWKYEDQKPRLSINKENLCIAYQDSMMLCYIISKASVKKLLAHLDKFMVNLPLDWFFFRQHHYFNCITIKSTSNIPCHIEDIESTFQTTQGRYVVDAIF